MADRQTAARTGNFKRGKEISTVFPGASREGIVRRKLLDPGLATERHDRPAAIKRRNGYASGDGAGYELRLAQRLYCSRLNWRQRTGGHCASPGAGALERPGQIRDDQEQRQGRQQYCKDDLLHSSLITTIVISGRPFGFFGQASRLPEPNTSGLLQADFSACSTSLLQGGKALL
jgi:hypothetical protein